MSLTLPSSGSLTIKFLSLTILVGILSVDPILHGGGSSRPPLEGYLASRLSGRSDWAHISWFCSFQHLLPPIEAIFQKKVFKVWKIKKMFFNRSDIKGSPLWKRIFENYFFLTNYTFSTWIWVLHVLSFFLRYITWVFVKMFKFSLFYHRIFIDNQVLFSTSHS